MTTPTAGAAQQSFAALRHPGFRIYWATNTLAMMADSAEHVMSYWVAFQKFKSPALAGFAVISHWVPYLFFAAYAGVLADRFDPRRLIQIGMALFMFCSVAWSLLILTDTLEMWHAVALLVVHGCAGVFWGPASQVLIYDIVGRDRLPSAVRLISLSRYMGFLVGPAFGGVVMLIFGPAYGLMLNAAIYLPQLLWLWRAPYGPRFRVEQIPVRAIRGVADMLATLRELARDRTLLSMILLSGAASFMISSAYQAQMPEFAEDLGHGDPGAAYGVLLAADAAGALVGGVLLESRNLLQSNPRNAFILAMLWCCALAGFAMSNSYPLAVTLLFLSGVFELAFSAMAQTLVQLHAPSDMRGRVIGLYSTAGLGMRAFSGVTIGFVGALIGVHWSLAASALLLLGIIATLFALTLGRGPATASPLPRDPR